MKRIFLVGPRGSGKTSVGRMLAMRLGLPFVDADVELQRRATCTIREIFANEGEAGFRDREAALLAEFCEGGSAVIATGGGVVVRADNRVRMKAAGVVVWLIADVDTLWQRIIGDATSDATRPNLAGGGRSEVETVLASREALYREVAQHWFDTAGRTPEELADAIVSLLSSDGRKR